MRSCRPVLGLGEGPQSTVSRQEGSPQAHLLPATSQHLSKEQMERSKPALY